MNTLGTQGEIQTAQTLKTGTEDERRFLVTEIPPNLARYITHSIEQGYLAVDPRGSEVRIRKLDHKYFQTVKTGIGGKRPETEFEIDAEEFAALKQHVLGILIEKQRVVIPYGDLQIELDFFAGELSGLVIAEVEFPNETTKLQFAPPAWFGLEITNQKVFKNSAMSRDGLPKDFEGLVLNPPQTNIPTFEIERGLEVAIEQIGELLRQNNRPVVLGIAGGSASGKTSAVAEGIKRAFEDDCLVISMDNYMRGDAYMNKLKQNGVEINWDHPLYTDFERLNGDLAALKLSSGEPVEAPLYSFKSGEPDGTQSISPKKLILIEGLFALDAALCDQLDMGIFVDIGEHGQLIRRLMRDVDRTSMSPNSIISYFLSTVGPMQQRFVSPQSWNADMIIDSEYKPRIEAQRSGLIQIQYKYRVAIDERKLLAIRAENLGELHQQDFYYVPTDRDFAVTGELLRVRHEGRSWTLTYKGPVSTDDAFTRPKFEVALDAETAHSLTKLYRGAGFTIEKDRTNYHLSNGCVLSVDRNVVFKNAHGEKQLGDWVEIRVPSGISSDTVEQLKGQLGLDGLVAAQAYALLGSEH